MMDGWMDGLPDGPDISTMRKDGIVQKASKDQTKNEIKTENLSENFTLKL